MASTVYTDFQAPAVTAAWLNDVNNFTYGTSPTTGPVLKPDLAASTGAGLVGFVQAGTGAVARTLQSKQRDFVSVKDFGAVGNGIADDTAAIQAAINAVSSASYGSSVLRFPKGKYLTTAPIIVNRSSAGITICGDGLVDMGTTTIYGQHTGDSILNLQGSLNVRVQDITLEGASGATFPQCGLLCARNGGGSAGWHHLDRLSISGNFSVAAHYNVASEGNIYINCFFNLASTATALKVLHLSGAASADITPSITLTGSTLLGAEFTNCHFYHNATTAGISSIYIDGSVALGSIAFRGGYLVQANGHFVSIRSGTIDGKDTLGPITFDGVGGERPGGAGVPISGFNLFASVGAPVYLRGLQIRKCNFLMAAGNYILQDSYVKLFHPVILSEGTNGSNTSALTVVPSLIGAQRFGLSSVANGECQDGLIDVGYGLKGEGVNQATLVGTWTQTFSLGNGYGIVGFYKDITGHVHLTGAPGSGTTGTVVFTLPVGYRPAIYKSVSCLSNTSSVSGNGDTSVFITPSGTVTVTGGVDPVYLSGIIFPTV